MAEVYLVKAKGILEEIREFLTFEADELNYKLYLPENQAILGYFKNSNLDFAKDDYGKEIRIYDILDSRQIKNLEKDIAKKNFVKKFDVDYSFLGDLTSFNKKYFSAKINLKGKIDNLASFLRDSEHNN